MSEEKKFSKKKTVKKKVAKKAKAPTKAFSVEKKIDEIRKSKLPKAVKARYIEEVAGPVEPAGPKILFSVYARKKGIRKSMHAGMLAFPKAKGVRMATVQEWDAIFKGF